jgi:mannose-6-phosphate isomerase-like protein (cupin superfamily)
MEEQIRQIAERMKGLREVLGITAEDAALTCGIAVEKYLEFETGGNDIPVSILHRFAHRYNVELTVLLTGQEPHMHHYSLVRKNQGTIVERRKSYKYQDLAQLYINRKAEPFLVTVEPKSVETGFSLNSHPGQEFNYILNGRVKFNLNGKVMELSEGDSIYFDSGLPHGMLALDNKECRFLAVII